MNPLLLSIVAILPIAVVALLLVIFRWPARRAMPISFLVTAGLSILIWQVPLQQVAAASINGLVVALTLLYIIFGAILLLNTLQESGAIGTIRKEFGESVQNNAIHGSDSMENAAKEIAFFFSSLEISTD